MNTINRWSCIIFACLIITRIKPMDPRIVVACNFDVISKNADTSNIISNAVSSARHILSCFYWRYITPWTLYSTIAHMQQRGLVLAKTTPGITNTIAKLFAELQRDGYGEFTDTAISCFNEMGVNPVPDPEALSLLQKVKSFNISTIGMGNQDSLEHEIYARKMLAEQQIDVHTLYDGIVTIPTLKEQAAFDSMPVDCFMRNHANPRWLVARNADCINFIYKYNRFACP